MKVTPIDLVVRWRRESDSRTIPYYEAWLEGLGPSGPILLGWVERVLLSNKWRIHVCGKKVWHRNSRGILYVPDVTLEAETLRYDTMHEAKKDLMVWLERINIRCSRE